MNKTLPIILYLITSLQLLWSQNEYFVDSYNWEENPTSAFDPSKNQDKDLIALKENTVSEFVFIENAGLVENLLIHKLFWLNSNDAIEQYNKVYLPAIGGAKLLKNKARVISKEGKIVELDDSKILESTDNEKKTTSKYYAMEGIEKGSFIEYFFVLQKYPSYTGKRVLLQDNYYKKEVGFEVFAPKNLKFAFKTYNDSIQVKKDTLEKERNHWVLNLKEVKDVEPEERSAYLTALKQVVFKLDRNYATPNKEIVSFGNIAQTLYTNYYSETDKKTKNKVQKFLKEVGVKANDENSIRKIENHIKSTIYLTKAQVNAEINKVSSIIDTKVASDKGLLSLYISIFKALDIEHEIVLTSNRKSLIFDEKFESYNVLEKYLFYFPKEDTYMEPLNYGSRYGFPNGFLTDNNGLFIKRVKIGDFESAVGEVRYIDPVNFDKSSYDLKMNLSFDEDNIAKTNIDLDRIMSGYYAQSLQPFMSLMKEENKEKTLKGIVKSIKEDVEISEIEALNGEVGKFGVEPFIVRAKLNTESFVDNAGNKYLFKVGELIGPQLEMYQDKKKELQIHGEFERIYNSSINIKIPEGYSFKNLEDLNLSESYEENGKNLFSFKSNYVVDNGVLKIQIKEFYNQNIVKTSIYEPYRKVINSAANFNKVILVMVKN